MPRLAVVRVADADASGPMPGPGEPGFPGRVDDDRVRPDAGRPTAVRPSTTGPIDADTLPTVPRARPARRRGGRAVPRTSVPNDQLPAERTSGAPTPAVPTPALPAQVIPARHAPEDPATLLAGMPEGAVVVHDGRGRIVAASEGFARLARTTVPELVGRAVDTVVVADPTPSASGGCAEVRPLGARGPVAVRLVPCPPAPGSAHRALVVVDVSDLVAATGHGRRSEPDDRCRREALSRFTGAGSWEFDRTRGTWTFSAVARRLLGLPVAAGTIAPEPGASVADCLHPAERARARFRWQALVEAGTDLDLEVRPAADPTRVLRVRAVRTGPADAVVVTGSVEDVTEQREMETRMRTSTQRFTDLLAVAPVGVALFDDHERLVQANRSLCRLLGEGQESLRGRRADELLDLGAECAAAAGADPSVAATPLLARPAGSAGSISWSCPARALRRRERGARGTVTDPVWCELHVSVSVDDAGSATHLVVFTDVTENRRVEESLRHLAMHDELTGLPNRRALTRTVSALLAGPTARRTAVLFCDLDNFKRVNDSLGHEAGDELLVALADRLRDKLPPGCSATRHSGDEFVVVCADVEACGGLDRLSSAVGTILRTAVPVYGQLVRVSATIGAAVGASLGLVAPPGDGELDLDRDPVEQVMDTARRGGLPDADPTAPDHPATADLLRFADAALFEAKSGSNRFALADEAIMRGADEALRLESELRVALANDELVLHFQPVVGPDGRMQTAEALVRWQHPEHGLIFPDKFLPVAEAADLMGELDRWVLRTATREAASWPSGGGRPVSVAVNLAGLLPGDPDFLETVREIVDESGLPWDRLVLELVETCLADLPPSTRQEMNELISAGVRFAVDDFGTGYSSLSRLTGLPAQIVKLDRGFVRGVATGGSDRAVARAVVELAAAIGQTCVAEGVENADQFAVLRDLGVDAYQGWLFARAMPSAALVEMLAGEVADAS